MKLRLDKLLLERSLTTSRERAQALILAGKVLVNGQKVEKAGAGVDASADIRLLGEDLKYVSRGGLKLEAALTHWQIDVAGKVCLDVGTSTGGFTDCLLQRGALRVIAVDTGHGQIDFRLRQDSRVVVLEQTNARFLTNEQIPEPVDVIVCDASFISLSKVLEVPLKFAKPGARLVALVKPQFEAGRAEVGKGGVVRDPAVHERVCTEAKAWVESQGWSVPGIEQSPITGPEGNVEFLLGAVKNG